MIIRKTFGMHLGIDLTRSITTVSTGSLLYHYTGVKWKKGRFDQWWFILKWSIHRKAHLHHFIELVKTPKNTNIHVPLCNLKVGISRLLLVQFCFRNFYNDYIKFCFVVLFGIIFAEIADQLLTLFKTCRRKVKIK